MCIEYTFSDWHLWVSTESTFTPMNLSILTLNKKVDNGFYFISAEIAIWIFSFANFVQVLISSQDSV